MPRGICNSVVPMEVGCIECHESFTRYSSNEKVCGGCKTPRANRQKLILKKKKKINRLKSLK